MLKTIFTLFLVFLFLSSWLPVAAQGESAPPTGTDEESLEGRVVNIIAEGAAREGIPGQSYQKLEVLVTRGSLKGKTVTVEVGGDVSRVGEAKYRKGDEIILSRSKDVEGNDLFYITDFVRRKPLFWLFFIFVVLVVIVSRWRGIGSLLGMAISFAVIFVLILPRILAGCDPVLVSIIGSLLIVPATFYLSHGFNRKTTTAILGTLVALVVTGLLARFFVVAAKLTGFASEEATFLQMTRPGQVNMRGLVLAGIIIGVLGVLDDIAVSQAAVVDQLRQVAPDLSPSELFLRAMRVGQDHIASMVNTLVLVYAGASLPLLLMFVNTSQSFSSLINYELIAEEVIRTLVGSIGLISAVPATTILASIFLKPKDV